MGLTQFALWVVFCSRWIVCLAVASDIPAMLLLRKLSMRRPRRIWNVLYLLFVLGVVGVFVGAGEYLSHIGAVSIGSATFVFTRDNTIIPVGLILAAPALLMLVASLVYGWPGRLPGFCAECNYDLTGNTSGVCPECGTPRTATESR